MHFIYIYKNIKCQTYINMSGIYYIIYKQLKSNSTTNKKGGTFVPPSGQVSD